MSYNFIDLPAPVLGIKNPDGTQSIAIKCRDKVYRTYNSTPEKIDEFIKTKKSGRVKEQLTIIGSAVGACIAGVATGFILKKDFEFKFMSGILGACAGALGTFLIPRGKKIDAAIAKLTEGINQEPNLQPAPQAEAAAAPATQVQNAGFNNLLKSAQKFGT